MERLMTALLELTLPMALVIAVLLAAAVAGSLVACTPGGEKNRYNIDLNDMDALSREYLAPLAAMGDIYWSGYQELKSGPLLKYAIYELYGYTGE